ncbi:hypothetical protein C8J56DRAFT_930796 [Mycena floridula]|nr:hypothetical protein C8J56DRAFT_930796 [Mycena floridula]
MGQQLETQISNDQVIRRYEIIERIIRIYNDRVFDVDKIIKDNGQETQMNLDDKAFLKSKGLDYITRLVTVDTTTKPKTRRSRTVRRVLACLSAEEIQVVLHLCRLRGEQRDERNALQHPKPHLTEAVKFIKTCMAPPHAETALNFLSTHSPRCLPTDPADVGPQPLFAFSLPLGPDSIVGKRKMIQLATRQYDAIVASAAFAQS